MAEDQAPPAGGEEHADAPNAVGSPYSPYSPAPASAPVQPPAPAYAAPGVAGPTAPAYAARGLAPSPAYAAPGAAPGFAPAWPTPDGAALPPYANPAFAPPADAQPQFAPSPYPMGANAGAPASAARPKTLALVALWAAIFGLVLAFAFAASAWPLLVFAVVLSIIGLASRAHGAKGVAGAALAISVCGLLICLIAGVISSFSSSSESYTADSPGPPSPGYPVDITGSGLGAFTSPYPYGETATVADQTTGEPVWEITVAAPTDLTDALMAEDLYNATPTNGAYLGFPVTLTYVGEGAVKMDENYDWSLEGTWGADEVDRSYAVYPSMPPSETQLYDVRTVAGGETVTAYVVVDATPGAPGVFELTVGYAVAMYWATPEDPATSPSPTPAETTPPTPGA